MTSERELAAEARAWPFEEARKLLDRLGGKAPEKGYVLFETGYGPSGLPHIGTFGEVVRTTMVRRAFEMMSDVPTRLFCFSDDMDGLRKVPDNVPKKDMLAEHLNKPLTSVPDPFGTHASFGEHNNARLRAFLDQLHEQIGDMLDEAVSAPTAFIKALLSSAYRPQLRENGAPQRLFDR